MYQTVVVSPVGELLPARPADRQDQISARTWPWGTFWIGVVPQCPKLLLVSLEGCAKYLFYMVGDSGFEPLTPAV